MIVVSEVSKRLGNFLIDQVSVELPAGYVCGLVGQNGAGKTSFLHLLLGLYRPDSGRIEINGLSYENEEKEIHDRMGAVLTEELFDPGLSAIENGSSYGNYYSGYDQKEFLAYLEQFKVDGKIKFRKLSRGQKLKCQFAFALACHPKILILDEPTANFDPEFRTQFLRIIQQFVSDGEKSVILATHLTEDLDRFADYLIYMEHGKITFTGDMETFRESYRIVSGEAYKIRLLDSHRILWMEEKKYGARALVKHSRFNSYDASLEVTYPSIEEFMYFNSKQNKEVRKNDKKTN